MSVDELYEKLQEHWSTNEKFFRRVFILIGFLCFLYVGLDIISSFCV